MEQNTKETTFYEGGGNVLASGRRCSFTCTSYFIQIAAQMATEVCINLTRTVTETKVEIQSFFLATTC
jgi:hypothetical protein